MIISETFSVVRSSRCQYNDSDPISFRYLFLTERQSREWAVPSVTTTRQSLSTSISRVQGTVQYALAVRGGAVFLQSLPGWPASLSSIFLVRPTAITVAPSRRRSTLMCSLPAPNAQEGRPRRLYMTHTTRTAPNAHEACALIQEGFDANEVLSVVGRCTVAYDGRTQSTLGPGDRIVLCKPDGTLLIHQPTGREPVNWQPPGGTHETALAGADVLVRSRRDSPAEVVEVRFEDVFQLSAYALDDEQELTLVGSEEDLRQRILADPTLVEPGFQPRATERETSVGPVDIYGTDNEDRPVIVELKRRRVGPDAVGQLARYVAATERERADTTVRGILVAPSITDRARRELSVQDLEFVALEPDGAQPTPTSLDQFTGDNPE